MRKQKLEKTRAKTRNIPNEKKEPNHSQRKQESGGKKESDNEKREM